MNNVNIVGRWVSDVVSKEVGDTTKGEGRIAVDTFKKDVAHFFDVEMWGKTAEIAAQYCKKGNFAIISGRLSQDTWEKDGEKRSKVYITAERVDLPPKTGPSQEATETTAPEGKARRASTTAPKPAASEPDDSDLF
jgi:single-strand DNA-binding protein